MTATPASASPTVMTTSSSKGNTSGCNAEEEGGQLMLHVAAGHAKHDIADCHWCAACNRGLADPHFVSQDNGESCDLACAYRKSSGAGSRDAGGANGGGGGGGDDGIGERRSRSSWYSKYKDRMYKDVVLTMPCKCSVLSTYV